ncbi:PH domain-containing protein [Williamsia sp.]|uniref:PH domain-containing protein n=1 Tax=Williamsia sp. TaxID=1872085 RepID=UPI001A2AE404|nr:PH domain-containing protein [Williamsia sp.]MBJ7291603.1 PH domain-containing protein [Williamsia sp.]
MDNSAQWATPRPVGVALLVGGVVLLIAAALSGSDPPGLVIMGVAGLLLAAMGLGSLLVRPRLAAWPDRLEIRGVTGRHSYTRAQITRIRIVSYPRFGRRVPNLEIDIDDDGSERLVILGRWELGEAPLDVADVLSAQGYPIDEDKNLRLRPDRDADADD